MGDSCRYLTIMEKTGRNMRLNENFALSLQKQLKQNKDIDYDQKIIILFRRFASELPGCEEYLRGIGEKWVQTIEPSGDRKSVV